MRRIKGRFEEYPPGRAQISEQDWEGLFDLADDICAGSIRSTCGPDADLTLGAQSTLHGFLTACLKKPHETSADRDVFEECVHLVVGCVSAEIGADIRRVLLATR